MDISILHSWLCEYLETDAKPEDIAKCLALCGPSVEKLTKVGDDYRYDIEITTNRVDNMSVIGVAREAAVILPRFGFKATFKDLKLSKPKTASKYTLNIEANEYSNRVMAVVIDAVKVGESPKWLQTRLEEAGIRSLNNLIDITNYVMTEVGHPTHVFDYDRLIGSLSKVEGNSIPTLKFRLSEKGEKLTTLDEKTYTLPGGDLVIVNEENEIIDLPGIMGTANSVVNDTTKRIVFFVDNNDHVLMRKTSMTLGIRTVAVTLNEKKVDPELAKTALYRGIELYKELAGGEVASKVYDFYHKKPVIQTIEIKHSFIESRLGIELKTKFVVETLKALDFDVKKSEVNKEVSYTITPPSFRSNDVTIKEDVVEEISRIYGYHNLPSTIPQQQPPKPSGVRENFEWELVAKKALKYWGYSENYTHSLIPQELAVIIDPKLNQLKLKNPLSVEWLYLRTSLVPSLLVSIQKDQDKAEGLKFFEMANVYLPREGELPTEELHLTIVSNSQSFLEFKGVVEQVGKELGLQFECNPVTHINTLYHPQIQAQISLKMSKDKEVVVGEMGQIQQGVALKLGVKGKVMVADLVFSQLTSYASKNKVYKAIPKYPPIVERLTFFNHKQVTASDILKIAQSTDQLITKIEIVDSYKDKLSLEMYYSHPDQNVTADDVTPIRKRLVHRLESLGIELQGRV